jgi:hypothetical protein
VISVNQRVFSDNQFLTPALSDDPPANILIVDVETGRIVSRGSMPAEKNPGAVQVVSDGRLAVWNLKGLQLCTPDLRCDPPLAGPGSVAVSPRGTRIVFGGFGMTPFRVLDAESLSGVAKYDDPEGKYGFVLGRGVIPGAAALLISRGTSQFGIHQPGKADKVVEFDLGGDFGASRFLNDGTFVYLEHNSSEAVVADLDGRQLHRYKLQKVYQAGFLPTAEGKRFGIHEYGFTFWNSVANFDFLGFEDSRAPDFQRVRVIEVSSGNEVARLEWAPARSPHRGFIEPQLSPSGHRLARIVGGVLEIVAVN